jgi:hypothetical protein
LRKPFLPTRRLIVGRDAPAQGKQSKNIHYDNFSGGQFGRLDVGLCLETVGLANHLRFYINF